MTALVILEGVVILLLVILVAGLLRSHAEILRRLHALDGGEPQGTRTEGLVVSRRDSGRVPDAVSGVTVDGAARSVALRGARGLTLLAFLSSGCTTCRPFWDSLAAGADMPRPDVRPVVVTRSPGDESPAQIAELAPSRVPLVMSSQAWDDFRIPVSPYFVLVDAVTGTVVGEGAASSWGHVRDLLAQALADAGWAADTEARAQRVADSLEAAGVEPGDPSLYRNPNRREP